MHSLDRFSHPLNSERVHLARMEEQNRWNKEQIVFDFIAQYQADYDTLPNVLTVLDELDPIALDDLVIKECLAHAQQHWR